MMEHDCLRIFGAPILVEDPSPVLRGDEGHVTVIPDQVAGQQDRRRCLVIGWRARTGQMSVELTPDSVAGQELLASCLCLVTEEPPRRRSRASAWVWCVFTTGIKFVHVGLAGHPRKTFDMQQEGQVAECRGASSAGGIDA